MCRVGVVAVGPDPAGLDRATHAVGDVAVAAPDAGAQAVERVVGDLERLGLVLEGGHGQHRAEDLLLEDAHLVVALEQGRLDVVAAGQVAVQVGLVAADQYFSAFLLAQVEVGHDLGQLFLGSLRAHHGVGIERAAHLDRRHARQAALHELVVDRFLDQRTARAGADLALVEGEQHQALDCLVQEAVVLVHHVGKEDVGRLAAQLQRGRDQVVGGGLRDHAAGAGRTGEGDLGDALAGGQRHAGFAAETVDDVEHAGRQQISDQLGQHQDRDRGRFGRLEHHAVARAQRRGQLPGRHQDREVPGDDLTDHAQRFLDVIGDRVVVDVAQGAFLRPHAAGEVAEMVDRQRDVGVERLADRLAVVDGLGVGQQLEVGFEAVGDLEQQVGALGGRGLAPGVGGGVRSVECQLDIGRARAGGLGVDLAGHRGDDVEVLAVDRRDPTATDEVVVLGLVGDLGAFGTGSCVDHLVFL